MICENWNLLEKIPCRWTGQSNYTFIKKEINSLNKKCRNVCKSNLYSLKYIINVLHTIIIFLLAKESIICSNISKNNKCILIFPSNINRYEVITLFLFKFADTSADETKLHIIEEWKCKVRMLFWTFSY